MAGLWDGLPASPCSAASDETPMRSSKHARKPPTHRYSNPPYATSPLSATHLLEHKRPVPQGQSSPQMSDQPVLKRIRSYENHSGSENMGSDPPSASQSVEFVEARDTNAESSTDLVARLNFSAADERRKALLQRLRDIDKKKAEIAKGSSGTSGPILPATHLPSPVVPDDDDIVIVEERSSPRHRSSAKSPTDIQDVAEAVPSVPKLKKAKTRPSTSRKVVRGRRTVAPTVIDVDNGPASSHNAKQSLSRPKKGSSCKSLDLSLPKRTSSRVRRPRSHIVDAEDSGFVKAGPPPACMSKCKRFQFCKKLISSLLRNSSAGPFSAPVRELWAPEAIPRYFDVISTPMDLGSVKKKMDTSAYITPMKDGALPYIFEVEKFADDVRLVFRNCMVYNRAGDMLYNCAKILMEDFEKSFQEYLPPPPTEEEMAQVLAKKRSLGKRVVRKEKPSFDVYRSMGIERPVESFQNELPDPCNSLAPATTAPEKPQRQSSNSVPSKGDILIADVVPSSIAEVRERLDHLLACRPAVLSRTPVPKGSGYLSRAAILYPLEISYKQKLRCSSSIENGKVPAAKLEALVELVKKSSGGGGSTGVADDEFEFEFDKLDNKAWRNIEAFLEQYVPGFKTIRSSCLGREFSSVEDVDAEIKVLRDRLELLDTEETPKTSRVASKSHSFFGEEEVEDESSSDSSDDDSDSDSSDSDSDLD